MAWYDTDAADDWRATADSRETSPDLCRAEYWGRLAVQDLCNAIGFASK
jgi:hypothetical protein